jgi:hypothetical protein
MQGKQEVRFRLSHATVIELLSPRCRPHEVHHGFVMPSGKADLEVVKSTLIREERVRRALLFSMVGGCLPCLPLKSLNPYSRAASGCDDPPPDFDISF